MAHNYLSFSPISFYKYSNKNKMKFQQKVLVCDYIVEIKLIHLVFFYLAYKMQPPILMQLNDIKNKKKKFCIRHISKNDIFETMFDENNVRVYYSMPSIGYNNRHKHIQFNIIIDVTAEYLMNFIFKMERLNLKKSNKY